MRSVTIDDVMDFGILPGYSRHRVEQLFGDQNRLTALDILESDIPYYDRLWAVLREDLISARVLHLFGCWCAEQALLAERTAGREPDLRIWSSLEAKRKWVDGLVTDDELCEAVFVANDAVESATNLAANSAARSVAKASGWCSCCSAREAAKYAFRALTTSAQCNHIVKMLRKDK